MTRFHRSQEGFTLIELFVGMLVGMIVLLATLQSLDLFSSSTSRQTRVLDANDQVRTLMERTVRDLRGAASITYAAPQDLIYTVPEPTGARTQRLCVSGGRLYGFSAVAPATAPTAATPCDSGSEITTLKSGPATGFTYDGASSSSTPSRVKNVGLRFSLDSGTVGATEVSTLHASATRRQGSLLLADEDLNTTCNKNGALLSLDADIPGVASLNVAVTNAAGVSIGVQTASGIQIPTGVTTVVATVTDALGVSSILSREVACG